MSASPEQQLYALIQYFRDMGVYDLYGPEQHRVGLPKSWRERPRAAVGPDQGSRAPGAGGVGIPARNNAAQVTHVAVAGHSAEAGVSTPRAASASVPETLESRTAEEAPLTMPKPVPFDALAPLPAEKIPAATRAAALSALRTEIGDCTRCPLAYAGRHTIVFGEGDANARLMFVGEGPGADEDAQGLPFVGKAGQLLNNMIGAMGLRREDVYIANIVKCRPPGNRTPEFVEATTCSSFLLRQIDIVQPQVIVALGATAATYLLGVRQSLSSLRGRWHSTRGAKLAVTYHPAFLLRDPRQKGEAWKDLQMVMGELGLKPPARKAPES